MNKKNKMKQIKKPVLDACCGSRMFWFDKQNQDVLFCDNRTLNENLCDGRKLEIEPDIIVDFTKLPFEDNTFFHVVFDPPHLTRVGDTSWLAKKYGKLPQDWEKILHDGFGECMRVLKPHGTLIFKWSETDISVSRIIDVIGYCPLYGHKSGRAGKTHWLAFIKGGEKDE